MVVLQLLYWISFGAQKPGFVLFLVGSLVHVKEKIAAVIVNVLVHFPAPVSFTASVQIGLQILFFFNMYLLN
jgi:hypothetical protein